MFDPLSGRQGGADDEAKFCHEKLPEKEVWEVEAGRSKVEIREVEEEVGAVGAGVSRWRKSSWKLRQRNKVEEMAGRARGSDKEDSRSAWKAVDPATKAVDASVARLEEIEFGDERTLMRGKIRQSMRLEKSDECVVS